jgi:hypothetical protein
MEIRSFVWYVSCSIPLERISVVSAERPVLPRIKKGSAPSKISMGCGLFRVRSARRLTQIVALFVCVLTFVQLRSGLSDAAAPSSPQATVYRFSHFPFEEVGSKVWLASSQSALQCDKIRVVVPPKPLPGRARMVLGAFVRSQPTTPVRFRIPPPSSDNDH